MKAVFVESLDGYLARGAADNMDWTPSMDKKIFKLLTFSYGGVCVCSRHTYNLLPRVMQNDKNRRFVIAARTGDMSLPNLNRAFPDAVLIGGPIFLRSAYDLGVIDTFVVTTVNKNIVSTDEYKNPFVFGAPLGQIDFGDMVVRVYNRARLR